MATTMTMPPTTHALPHAQRLRLIRSTRKLGALLGETPLLVETAPTTSTTSFTPSHSRSGSTMSTESKRSGHVHMTSGTLPRTSSLNLAAAPVMASHGESFLAPHVPRPMLLLHLPAHGRSSPAERTPLPSPLSPTFSLALNSPATPTISVDTSRRRKMAKLMRTLGENVPPELVFPTSTPKARRRASTLSVPESILERDLVHKNSAASLRPVPVEEPFSYPSTVPFVAEGRSSSETRVSSDIYASGSSHEYLLPHPRPRGSMHRKEQGWSGEWGGDVANMEDVVRSLRGLKMK